MVDNRVGSTQGFAVVVTKPIDDNGNSLGALNMYFAHSGAIFDGTFADLDDCCYTP